MGNLKKPPRLVRNVQVMIAEKIFGADSWEDAIKVLPVLNLKNIADAYNHVVYTFRQCPDNFQVLCNPVTHVKELGGFGFMDGTPS